MQPWQGGCCHRWCAAAATVARMAPRRRRTLSGMAVGVMTDCRRRGDHGRRCTKEATAGGNTQLPRSRSCRDRRKSGSATRRPLPPAVPSCRDRRKNGTEAAVNFVGQELPPGVGAAGRLGDKETAARRPSLAAVAAARRAQTRRQTPLRRGGHDHCSCPLHLWPPLGEQRGVDEPR